MSQTGIQILCFLFLNLIQCLWHMPCSSSPMGCKKACWNWPFMMTTKLSKSTLPWHKMTSEVSEVGGDPWSPKSWWRQPTMLKNHCEMQAKIDWCSCSTTKNFPCLVGVFLELYIPNLPAFFSKIACKGVIFSKSMTLKTCAKLKPLTTSAVHGKVQW